MDMPINTYNSPFIKILPIVIIGILIGEATSLHWGFYLGGVVISALCLWLFINNRLARNVYSILLMLCTALTMSELRTTTPLIPHDKPTEVILEIVDNPATTSGGYHRTTARAYAYRSDGEWVDVNEKLMVTSHPTTPLHLGRSYQGAITIGDMSSNGWDSYARLMYRRGYTGSAFVGDNSLTEIGEQYSAPIRTLGARWQYAASERMALLDLDAEAMAVAEAMTLGWREGLTKELKSDYSLSGASHLLAVSGLHIGIILLIFNTLLLPLLLIRNANLWKPIIVLLLIWLYTLMTGCAPSTVRAAIMFSAAEIATTLSLNRSPINILLATATLMLIANPNNLFDIGFQLSSLSVLGIALFYTPIYRLGECSIGLLNRLWGMLSVSMIATTMSMPILAHTFGIPPITGVLVSPIVVLCATIVITATLIWVIIPAEWLSGVVEWVINNVAGLQNSILDYCSTRWSTHQVDLPVWGVLAIYGVILVGIVVYQTKLNREKHSREITV